MKVNCLTIDIYQKTLLVLGILQFEITKLFFRAVTKWLKITWVKFCVCF